MLSSEQKKMILNHLRRPENDLAISEIAGQIAQNLIKLEEMLIFQKLNRQQY